MAQMPKSWGAERVIIALVFAFGLLSAGIGIHMLIAPLHWYETTPGVMETGGFNPHFIRDIGIAFLTGSAALMSGLILPKHRRPLLSIAFIWFAGHALLHVVEQITTGNHDHLWVESLVIMIPAVLILTLLLHKPGKGKSENALD